MESTDKDGAPVGVFQSEILDQTLQTSTGLQRPELCPDLL